MLKLNPNDGNIENCISADRNNDLHDSDHLYLELFRNHRRYGAIFNYDDQCLVIGLSGPSPIPE